MSCLSTKDASVAATFPEFYKYVQQIEEVAVAKTDKFASLSSDSPIFVKNSSTTGSIFSKTSVLIKDCEEVGPITAPTVVLMRCKKTGKIRASNVHSFESDNSGMEEGNLYRYCFTDGDARGKTITYQHGTVRGDIRSTIGTIELIDRIVMGAVIFGDHKGPFRGRVLLRGTSSIHDLERTNADVFYSKDKVDHKQKEKSSSTP